MTKERIRSFFSSVVVVVVEKSISTQPLVMIHGMRIDRNNYEQ